MSGEQFLHAKYHSMALADVEPNGPLDSFNTYEPPTIKRYITRRQT